MKSSSSSRALTHVADSIAHSQNLLMVLAGIVVLIMVWGYNELADARQSVYLKEPPP